MEEKLKSKKENNPSYDDLKNWCNQLYGQNVKLTRALNSINILPYLFEVLKAKDFFDDDFVDEIVSDIKSILKKPKVEQEKSVEK